jgi:hypothetical protein
MTPSRIWLPTARIQVARAGVGLAAVFGLLGQVITFYPGAEVGWFGVAAALALAGLLSPTRRLRLVAVVLAVLLAGFAWGGYERGRQYREPLSQQAKLLGLPSLQAPRPIPFVRFEPTIIDTFHSGFGPAANRKRRSRVGPDRPARQDSWPLSESP